MKRKLRAEVVVFSSLLFLIMLTFSVSVMDATTLEMAKSYRRADMNRSLECVFAEYQQELLEHYDVFAMDASYETGTYRVDQITKRLEYYGVSGTTNSVKRLQFLTDDSYRPFIRQAVLYTKEKYGLGFLDGSKGNSDSWKDSDLDAYDEKEHELGKQLEDMLLEEENSLKTEGNPMQHIASLKSYPILELVMPRDEEVSRKRLGSSGLLSNRSKNKGKGSFQEEDFAIGSTEKLFFLQYLGEHYSCFTDPSHGNETIKKGEVNPAPLDYELEYLVAGKLTDQENLEAVVKKLIRRKTLLNFAYLQTDPEKKGEAEAMAVTLSVIALSPELTEMVTQGILMAWAYGEAIMDVRSLLAGHKVSVMKTSASWQLSLGNLLKLGTKEDQSDGKHTKNGLEYKEYLKLLLASNQPEKNSERALTIAEQDLRTQYGLSWFHADHCLEKIEFNSTSSFRRGIRYKYKTYFAYQ